MATWIAKALAERVLDVVPRADGAVFFLQRRVTKTLPRGDVAFQRKLSRALHHFGVFREHTACPSGTASFYEFGAGWDLVIPLVFYSLGINRQIIVDIRRNVRLALVGDTIARYGRCWEQLQEQLNVPLRPLGRPEVGSFEALRERFGIDYRAPVDARETDLESRSVDFVSSTNTLEHVPERDLRPLLEEARRVLRPRGVLSCRVDMADHYAYCDRSLSPYHFLTLCDWNWALVNPPRHYQNRLRCSDYVSALTQAGFALLHVDAHRPSASEGARADLDGVADRFRRYSLDDLAVTAATFVARPVPSAGGTHQPDR